VSQCWPLRGTVRSPRCADPAVPRERGSAAVPAAVLPRNARGLRLVGFSLCSKTVPGPPVPPRLRCRVPPGSALPHGPTTAPAQSHLGICPEQPHVPSVGPCLPGPWGVPAHDHNTASVYKPLGTFHARSRLQTAALWLLAPVQHLSSPATAVSEEGIPCPRRVTHTHTAVSHGAAWSQPRLAGCQQPRLEPPKTHLGCPQDRREVGAVRAGKGLSCHGGFHTSRADAAESLSCL